MRTKPCWSDCFPLPILWPLLVTILVIGFLLVAECQPRKAHAQLYVEGFGSLSSSLLVHGSQHDTLGSVQSETAPAAGMGLRIGGYREGGYLGAELEVMHTNAPIKAGTLTTWLGSPDVTQMLPGRTFSMHTVGVNGLVRYPRHLFEPFLGVGLFYGVATLGPDVCANGWPACGPLSSGYADSSQTAATVGYTFKTGGLFKVTEHWGLTLTYQVQVVDFQFSGVIPGNCCGGVGEMISGGIQTAQAGVRYTF